MGATRELQGCYKSIKDALYGHRYRYNKGARRVPSTTKVVEEYKRGSCVLKGYFTFQGTIRSLCKLQTDKLAGRNPNLKALNIAKNPNPEPEKP